MILRPPISTRTDTLFPYTTLFRSPPLGRPDTRRRQDRWKPSPGGVGSDKKIATPSPISHREKGVESELFSTPLLPPRHTPPFRSEERRVGKECVSRCISGRATYH